MFFLLACSDVRQIYGHVECDEATSTLLFTAELQMRQADAAAAGVLVEAQYLGVTRADADLELDDDRPKLDTWSGDMPANDDLINCSRYRDACYLFTATDEAGLKVDGVAGNEDACSAPTYTGDDDDGGGGGGTDECPGTLRCNDGTTSCTCYSCDAGCCSGHDGCD